MVDYFTANNVDEIISCINRGDDINCTNYLYQTPLNYHCGLGNTNIVLVLLNNYNIDIHIRDICYMSAFDRICLNGHIDLLDLFLGKLRVDVNRRHYKHKNTPLMYGIRNVDVVDRLLIAGADVNETNSCGLTAVHLSCLNGDLHILDRLICYGGNLKLIDGTNMTPLAYAKTHNFENIISRLNDMDIYE